MKHLLSGRQQQNMLVLGMLILIPHALIAQEDELPEKIPGTVTINAEQLIDIVGQNESLLLIDARLRSDHKQGFIEGSVNLPNTVMSCHRLKKFTGNGDQPILFYCNGPKCERSIQAVQIAQQCGYQNIFWFRGGMDEWKQKGYPYIKR